MVVKIVIHDIPTPADEDGAYADVERRYLQHCLDNNIPVLVLVVGGQIGGRSDLISLLKEGVNRGLFTIGNHGDEHSSTAWNPSGMTLDEQKTYIQNGESKIESALNVSPKIFIPPYYKCNEDTFHACRDLGIKLHTAAVGGYWSAEPIEDAISMTGPNQFTSDYASADELRAALSQKEKDYGYVFWDIHPHHSAKAGEDAISMELEVMKDYAITVTPTLAETVSSMVSPLVSIMMVMMVVSIIKSIVKKE